jgi:2-polyprenyl-6-methoxyphenol hydroxylase-like FAD-dependent oxidoreductase
MNSDRAETTKIPFRVLIIGGGIGGLCLAQGLKRAGISVAVYERDQSAHFRSQGYRIHINADGSKALHACLPDNLFDLFAATSGKPATGRFASFDSHLQELNSRPLHQVAADSPFILSTEVNRLTLREILLAGLDDTVHFSKTLERIEQIGRGQVCAYFADGSSAQGEMLIGADGTSSVVRQHLLPDAKVFKLGFAIYGRTPLTPQAIKWIPENLITGFSRVTDPSGVAMMFGTYRKREEFSKATAAHAPDLHLMEAQDYLMWTFRASLGHLGLTDEQFWCADPVALHAAVSERVKEWHPSLRRILAEADIPATFPVGFHASEPVRPWRTTNVTLLGDAVHTMPPFRGVGANTALRDAELLSRKLMEVAEKRMTLFHATSEYEAEMRRYGFEAVKNSVDKPLFGNQDLGESHASERRQ